MLGLSYPAPPLLPAGHDKAGRLLVRKWHQCCASGAGGWGIMKTDAPAHPGRPCLHSCVMELMKRRNWNLCNALWDGGAMDAVGLRGIARAFAATWVLGSAKQLPHRTLYIPTIITEEHVRRALVESGAIGPDDPLDDVPHPPLYGWSAPIVAFSIPPFSPAVHEAGSPPRHALEQYTVAHGDFFGVDMGSYVVLSPFSIFALEPPWVEHPSGAPAATPEDQYLRYLPPGFEPTTIPVRKEPPARPRRAWALKARGCLSTEEVFANAPRVSNARVYARGRPPDVDAAGSDTVAPSTAEGITRVDSYDSQTSRPPQHHRGVSFSMSPEQRPRHVDPGAGDAKNSSPLPPPAEREQMFCVEVRRQVLSVELGMFGMKPVGEEGGASPVVVGEEHDAAAAAAAETRVRAAFKEKLTEKSGHREPLHVGVHPLPEQSRAMSPRSRGVDTPWVEFPVPTDSELRATYERLRHGASAAAAVFQDRHRQERAALDSAREVSPMRNRSHSPNWEQLARFGDGIPSPPQNRASHIPVDDIILREGSISPRCMQRYSPSPRRAPTRRPGDAPPQPASPSASATRSAYTTSFALLEREEHALRRALLQAERHSRQRFTGREYQQLAVDSALHNLQIRETLCRHRLERSLFLRLEEPIRRQWIACCADFAFLNIVQASDPWLLEPYRTRLARSRRAKRRERKLNHLRRQYSELANMGIGSP